ncbi:MAG TPA: alpha/beta hydrolase [Steroidobacteraceae bacterium]|nr:alpha/beta hydrolase [Steroidobacteraceae bacterium]
MRRYRQLFHVSQDGLRLHARIYAGPAADAPVVLCLHGVMRNARDFEDLAPHLQSRYRLIAADLRGRGFSARDPNPENYRPAVYVRDLLDLLAAAQVGGRIAIIGTSLGGILAMMLANSHRPMIAGIVLNDVGPELDPAGVERIKGYAGRTPPPRDWSGAAAQTQEIYGAAWRNLAPQRWPVLARRGYREDAAGILRVDADPLIGAAMRSAPVAPLDLWPLWAGLGDVPALGIRGAASDLLSAAVFARMRAEKPDLRQLTVADRGHVPLLDEPECLLAIDMFLAEIFH